MTETSQTIIEVALTTNENIINACDVRSSIISDRSLDCLTVKLKAPKPRSSYVTTRSYKNYDHKKFVEDLDKGPFHMVNFFDYFDDRAYAFNRLFSDMLDNHAPSLHYSWDSTAYENPRQMTQKSSQQKGKALLERISGLSTGS